MSGSRARSKGDGLMRTILFHGMGRAFGLMFRKPAASTQYLFVFDTDVRTRFHTWFVFQPIDLYFLDAARNVVDAKREFQPFSSYKPRVPFRYAVETKTGLFAETPKKIDW